MRHLPSRAEHKGRVSSEKRRTLQPAKLEGVDIYVISVWSPRYWTQSYRSWYFPWCVLVLLWSSISLLCSPSSLWEFSLCWKYVIYFLVLQGGGSQLRDYFDIQMDFELLSKVETWRTTRTSEVGLNTFCIMRQPWTFEGQGMECGDVSTKCPHRLIHLITWYKMKLAYLLPYTIPPEGAF